MYIHRPKLKFTVALDSWLFFQKQNILNLKFCRIFCIQTKQEMTELCCKKYFLNAINGNSFGIFGVATLKVS